MMDTSPISHLQTVSTIPPNGTEIELHADEDQRRALADVHGLEAVRSFIATLQLSRWKKSGLRLTGRVEADIVQNCVVTLDPIETHLSEPVDALLVPEGSPLARVDRDNEELVLSMEGDDIPETFSGGRIDIGQIAEEFFALGIDLYPRKDGVDLPRVASEPRGEEDHPFAELKALRTGDA